MWDDDKKKHKHIGDREVHPETLMMGYGYRPEWSEGAVKPPIFQTSTFCFASAEEGKAFFEVAYGLREKGASENIGLIYSRLNNPGLEILEDRLTIWDGAEEAAVFESGMAAIATTLLTFLRPRDVVAFPEPVYGGTEYLLHRVLPELGIEPACFPATEGIAGLERVLAEDDRRERLRMIYMETPANPTNDLVDIEACKRIARTSGDGTREALLVVDNTFLGPLFQHPIRHGADLVVYSLTKYVGGHSDLIAGACLGRSELLSQVKTTRTIFGSTAGPWTCWLLMRSLETLKLRMTSQMKNARYLADFLVDHPKVKRVHYLGHLQEGDPGWEIYAKQCLGAGGMISFEVRGGEAEAFRFLNALELVKLAVSLGGTESLAEHPGTMTHADVEPDDQARMGITPALVRISVGVEHPDDLIADVEQALAKV
jgi:methionine-gamma-lyase